MLIWKLSVLHSNAQTKNTVAKFFLDEPGKIPYPSEFSPYSEEIAYVSN